MTIPTKLCIFCKHFYAEESYSYSTMTQGGGYFGCRKGHHEAQCSGPDDGVHEFRKAIMFAVKCPDYDEAELSGDHQ